MPWTFILQARYTTTDADHAVVHAEQRQQQRAPSHFWCFIVKVWETCIDAPNALRPTPTTGCTSGQGALQS